VVLRAGRPLAWYDRRGHHLVTFPDTLDDPSWIDALVALVAAGRARSVEIRKIDGLGLGDATPVIVEQLRRAGFADGYRGLVARR
jgi:ATP-dependent Lhr-like helicase